MNAVEIEEAVAELAHAPFDSDEFPFAFLAAFGNKEDWSTPEKIRDLNRFMARLILCFFAEDTDIFSSKDLLPPLSSR